MAERVKPDKSQSPEVLCHPNLPLQVVSPLEEIILPDCSSTGIHRFEIDLTTRLANSPLKVTVISLRPVIKQKPTMTKSEPSSSNYLMPLFPSFTRTPSLSSNPRAASKPALVVMPIEPSLATSAQRNSWPFASQYMSKHIEISKIGLHQSPENVPNAYHQSSPLKLKPTSQSSSMAKPTLPSILSAL